MKICKGKQYCLLATLVGLFTGMSLWCPQETVLSIPVCWTTRGTPVVPLVIEGGRYYVTLNFGSSFDMTLNEGVLETLVEKQPTTSSWVTDFDGTEKEVPRSIIPKASLGNFSFSNLITNHVEDVVKQGVSLWRDPQGAREWAPKIIGSIGIGVLQRTNWLLDFAHNTAIACNSKKLLAKKGYDFNAMIKVAFECSRRGEIIISADTSAGPLKLQLATESTVSMLQRETMQGLDCPRNTYGVPEFRSKKLVLGSHDFGEQPFVLFDIPSVFAESDGFLSMDFLQNHVVYIDYSDKELYIQ